MAGELHHILTGLRDLAIALALGGAGIVIMDWVLSGLDEALDEGRTEKKAAARNIAGERTCSTSSGQRKDGTHRTHSAEHH